MRSEERDAKPNCQAVPSCKSNLCRELFPCWLGQRLLRVALTPQSEDEKFKLQSMSRPWSAKCESSIHLTCNGHPPGTLRTLSQSKPQSMRTSHQNSNPEHKPCGMAPSMLHSHSSSFHISFPLLGSRQLPSKHKDERVVSENSLPMTTYLLHLPGFAGKGATSPERKTFNRAGKT